MRTIPLRFVLAVFVAGAPAGAQTPVASPPAPCRAPENRQFDFWIGDWNVQDAAGEPAGTNRIEPIQDGCVLLETWKGARGGTGNSFNMYDAASGTWRQTWVDNKGGRLDLAGGLRDGRMVLEGDAPARTDPGKRVQHRISWERRGANVRQLWQASRDGGRTWTVLFDGLYVPAPAK